MCKVFAHRITDFEDFTVFASESQITRMTRMNADKIPASRPFDPDKHVLRIADYAVLLQNHGLRGFHGFCFRIADYTKSTV